MNKQQILKMTTFIIIGALLISGISYFSQPAWKDWNNYNTVHGFYEEPENTIETVFLGASIVINGITPTELYEDYGICAYNLATEQQPVLASYYWLEEAERLHGDTLKTVVFDTSMLRRTPIKAFYQKALDGMHFSSVKVRAVADYTEDANEMLSYLCPLFAYHGRWNTLNSTDFEKKNYQTVRCVRGYNFVMDRIFENMNYDEFPISKYYTDDSVKDTKLNEESLYYLKKMIEYCKDHQLKLVLMKTPGFSAWGEADHNAVEHIASAYDLQFFDFNYEPYLDEINYIEPLDSLDGGHMNYSGARKLTKWIGQFLTEKCDATDIRDDEAYHFMEDELEEYHEYVSSVVELKSKKTVTEYFQQVMRNDDYTAFIVVQDEAAGSLTEEQRQSFEDMGLTELSQLEYRDSYIGIMDSGEAVYEQTDHASEHQKEEEEAVVNDLETAELKRKKAEQEESPEIKYSYELKDGTEISLRSGGYELGNISSCIINHVDYSTKSRGLNLVVYDKKYKRLVDSTVFDTCMYTERDGWNLEDDLKEAEAINKKYQNMSEKMQKLVLYQKRCDAQKEFAEVINTLKTDDFLELLEVYKNRKHTILYMAVAGDASDEMKYDVQEKLHEENMDILADLTYQESYIGIVSEGEVIFEKSSHGTEPISKVGNGYKIISAGGKEEMLASIVIGKYDYSPNEPGLNVVLYDTELESVIGSAHFYGEEN